MNGDKLMQQVSVIFSVFMVFFYFGVGCFLIFFSQLSYLDKAVRVIMGSSFIFYGIFRAYTAYTKIIKVFFTDDSEAE
jgi:hypothetical protein